MINENDAAVIELNAMKSAWHDLAIRWQLTWQERRALLPMGSENSDQPHGDTERRMRILIEIGYRLRVTDEDRFQEWLRSPAISLRYLSPIEAMSGSIQELRRFRAFVDTGFGA